MAIKLNNEEFNKKFGSTSVQKGPNLLQKAGQEIKSAASGGVQTFKQGVSDVAHAKNPLQVIEGGLKAGAGVAGAVFSPAAPVFNPVMNKVTDKISNIPQVQQFANSKIGSSPITSRVLEDVSNAGATAGLATLGVGAPKIESGIKATGELAGRTTGNALTTTGRVLKGAGEKAYEVTIPASERTAQMLMRYDAKKGSLFDRVGMKDLEKPTTEANTAARLGLTGTEYGLGVKATKAASDLWTNTIQPKLAAVKGQVNMKTFFDEIQKEIQKTPELSRRSDVRDALASLREDYQNVGKNINLETLQDYKKGWADVIPEAAYKGKPIGSALKEVKNIAAEKARQIIYKHIGEEGKQAYIDYGNLQSIIKSGVKSITGDPAAKSITRNVWQFVMDKAVTPVATHAGKILYKTGEGLELIGPKGAKTIGDIVGNPKIGLSIDDASKKPKVNNYQMPKINNYQETLDYKGIKVNNYQTKKPTFTKGKDGKFTGSTRE